MQTLLTVLRRAGRSVRIWLLRTIAVLLIVVGMVVFPLPIPIGLLMMVMGLALLISSSHAVAEMVRGFRRRYPKIDARLRAAEPRLPGLLRPPLRKTDPLHHPEPPEASEDDASFPGDGPP